MSISASAVLVELNISVWPASKVDKEVTDQVNTSAGAVRDAVQCAGRSGTPCARRRQGMSRQQ